MGVGDVVAVSVVLCALGLEGGDYIGRNRYKQSGLSFVAGKVSLSLT